MNVNDKEPLVTPLSALKNRFITAATSLFICVGVTLPAHALDASIERDVWGVPHIHGKTAADAAFGLGYAQAEDTWKVIESTLPYYRGNAGGFFGPDGARSDFLVHWLGLWDDLNARYERDLSADTRRYIEAFAAGINHYAKQHPDVVELDVLPVTGKDIIAAHMLRHLLFYGFDATVRELMGEERAKPISPASTLTDDGAPTGSNAIAVSPTRSSDGSTLLVINSHQPLTGPVAWYEAHIQSDDGLDVMGGLFPGAPAVGVGFTPTTAWGATVNKPDLVDVYVLDIDPDNPNRYRLDDEWRELEVFDIELDVLIWGFIPWSVTETGYRSVHGPVLKTEHGTYAVRYAGMGELRQIEQWLAMNRARDLASWRDAIGLNHIQSFNFVYADIEGNIEFIHNSEMPQRLPGWNWQHYLPGNRSDLIWQDYLSVEQLPHISNPESGFILSVNQTPFRISAEGSNPDPLKSPAESGWQTRMTNRAVRGLELFDQHPKLSADTLLAIKHDNHYSPNYRGVAFLQQVIALDVADADLKAAQDVLARWDLGTDKDNRQAALGVCIIRAEWRSESRAEPTPDPRQTLDDCVDEIMHLAGDLEPRWGDLNRHGRGDTHYALAGGPDTLRAAYGDRDKDDDLYKVTAGDGLYYLVRWNTAGEQSVLGVHQYGNHFDTPEHPHYLDQAQDFANETLHPVLFSAAQREPLVERRYRVSTP